MDTRKLNKFTACGGCIAKLPQGLLKDAVANIPAFNDPDLLVGFDTSDDGAVYRLQDDLAVIQTLDFFPPMVNDPYLFGKIAAANALSDIYAMGGQVKTALNIVCFPENEDPAILGEILRGGAEKVKEAGGVLCGGHSINDKEPKYGLSVTGVVHPDRIMHNNRCQLGDRILLTKPLGVGMVTSSYKAGAASRESYEQAVDGMQTLNKYAFDIAARYRIHSCTDVTGFGFLGHLNEMVTSNYSIRVDSRQVLYIPEAWRLAEEFLITGGGQKNRSFLQAKVGFYNVPPAMEEILFDPQTSGGLLISVAADDAAALLEELNTLTLASCMVGEVVERADHNIVVDG
ncbi:Selenide, water dikinase [Sporomusa ovata DSM 2662]|uniref:Selenide, water dikinase n=1 Tax=Sporomusa ovata TaxID=2378 RepID=A0A0U1KUX8_9FIRM|nr:selenide, water dikinase SelD [Sporomusa ovata]EQB27044.1 selenide, water dikinase [Sporomusa ovata DSM 2662]CQR71146.1 Selenide,water dikinase @ selenocysteine-containing [Sporomusa ovata]